MIREGPNDTDAMFFFLFFFLFLFFIFFIKAYVVGTRLNCIDKSTYAFIKK